MRPVLTATIFRAIVGAALAAVLGFAAYAFAGTAGDATIRATTFTAGRGLTGAYARCPADMRVVGGGVLNIGGPVVAVGASGPLDSTVSPSINPTNAAKSTTDGDMATQWYAGVANDSSEPAFERVFALCSTSSDATVQVTRFAIAGRSTGVMSVKCPTGQRAVGGGVIEFSWPDNRILASGPLDSSGKITSTTDGDVATQWYSAVHNLPNHTVDFKAFAVCSRDSLATVAASPFSVGAAAINHATTTCPSGRRALGGGIIQEGPARFLRVLDNGPLDASAVAANASDGAIAQKWYAAIKNRNTHRVDFKVLAVCEPP
jgi:hypothetical protein